MQKVDEIDKICDKINCSRFSTLIAFLVLTTLGSVAIIYSRQLTDFDGSIYKLKTGSLIFGISAILVALIYPFVQIFMRDEDYARKI